MTKPPPNNPDAESAVLGAVLMDDRFLNIVKGLLTVEDFYTERNRMIFESMLAIEGPVDHLTLSNELKRRDLLDKIGGVMALSTLSDAVVTTENVEHYAGIVADLSVIRGIRRAGQDIVNLTTQGLSATDTRQQSMDTLKSATISDKGSSAAIDGASYSRVATDEAVSTEPVRGVVLTRLDAFDSLFGGLYPDTPYMIAGRPGMGKSTLSINIALNAMMAGARVLFYTFEEGRQLLVWRMLSRLSGVGLWKIRNRALSDRDREQIREAGKIIEIFDFKIVDSPMTAKQIIDHAESENYSKKVDLGIVDILTKVLHSGPKDDFSATRVTSKNLSRLPGVTVCPWVILHQLNRGVEGRKNAAKTPEDFMDAIMPQLADLRDAGEEDFKGVIGVTRPYYYDKNKDANEFALKMMKNNNGPCGTVRLWCDLATMNIRDQQEEGY